MNRQYCPPRHHSLPPITIISPLRRISRICLRFFDGTITSSCNLKVDSRPENLIINIIQRQKSTLKLGLDLFFFHLCKLMNLLSTKSQPSATNFEGIFKQMTGRNKKQKCRILAVLTKSLHLLPGGRKQRNELFDEASRNGNWHQS